MKKILQNNIVFIHGMAGSKNNFKYLSPKFPGSLIFDLPGFGEAPKPNVKYDKELFIEFLEKKITKPSILVGHSLGAILACDFAIKHPNLVNKVFCINYPLQKSRKNLRISIMDSWIGRLFITENLFSKILCRTKRVWKYIFLPIAYLLQPKYFDSTKDYFKHTYQSEISTLRDTILQDDPNKLSKINDKIFFIAGEHDPLLEKKLLTEFKHKIIPKMGHLFFEYEDQVAEIIANN